MKYPHSIPLRRTNEEVLPGDVPCRMVLSSAATKWKDILVEEHHLPSIELADVTYKRHAIVINIGRSTIWESKKQGSFGASSRQKARFPSS